MNLQSLAKKQNPIIRAAGSLSIHKQSFLEGVKDGVPIATGYFAVAFTLGIAAQNVGLSAFQGFILSLFNNASAGEYAGLKLIAVGAAYWEVALMTLVANARYLLMSCALSQKFSPSASLLHRFLVGFDVTDELFGISMARKGWLDPYYYYGAMVVSIPCWASGTAVGVISGNILPANVVTALNVALFGMFLSAIIPSARKSRIIAGLVALSFAASFAVSRMSFFAGISDGTRTIILTVVISASAALLFPVKEKDAQDAE